MTVGGGERNRGVVRENGHVMKDLATAPIQTQGMERCPIAQCCRQPDLLALYYRRRPAKPLNRRLPGDVFLFIPCERQPRDGSLPLAVGTTKLRPITVRGDRRGKNGQATRKVFAHEAYSRRYAG